MTHKTSATETKYGHRAYPMGHTSCDRCDRLSGLYESWPVCRDCRDTVCPDCFLAATEDIDGAEDGSGHTALCHECQPEPREYDAQDAADDAADAAYDAAGDR